VPVLAALVVVFLVVLAAFALMPLSLVLRYRASTARRMARGWVAVLNVAALTVSVALFLGAAAITTYWAPTALRYALGGLATGMLLGLLGLWWSRWEATPGALHYTPNRWLVLAIMLVVGARLLYGLWRAWHAWQAAGGDESWLAAAGVAGSLAAGAVVLGYYLAFGLGVWGRFKRHRRFWTASGRLSPRR
jgi:hypothetical protein